LFHIELIIKPPKGIIHQSSFNPGTRDSQNYNIVEYLAQAPLAMSNIEVLQNGSTQKKALLSTIGCIDPSYSNVVVFNHDNYTPHIQAQLAFMIQVVICRNNIHYSIMDE